MEDLVVISVSQLENIIRKVVSSELNRIKSNEPALDTNKRMNVNEVAAYINVSPDTIRNRTGARTIPHHKEGKFLIFYKNEIDAWNDARRKKVKTI